MVNKFKIIAKVMIIFYIIPSERTIYLDTQTQRLFILHIQTKEQS